MSKLSDKLFDFKGNDPYLRPVGLHIKEFRELWDADKSEEKSQYAKELAIVYHMCDYESPFYDMKNKEKEIYRQYTGSESYKVPKRVLACIEYYNKLNNTPEKRALDAAVALCDSISDSMGTHNNDAKQLDDLIKELDFEIKQAEDVYTKIELLKQKNELKKALLESAKTASDLIPKMEKYFDSLVKMRVKVMKASYEDGNDNTKAIDNFLMDEIRGEIEYEQGTNKK